ncbi:hypothetical protein DFJ63DRAFT_56528 [Scheffersomyces coipomensis]|uniref:uncharacterized protein n=1 Tax=Scheffersomyces coipomensis TaxID=1788519 RepID=UPI00315D1A35
MGSVQQLVADFTTLGLESKRRFPEIKQGCDTAINQLKSLDQTSPINDIQLNDNSTVIIPFINACKSGNAKLITLSIPIIHRLIMATIIPPSCLNDLVDSLQEASNLAIDIQLRILQCLPTLMQNYHTFFTGPLLIKLLTVCSNLTANNKSTVVINTASATLQQLFSNIFDINPESSDESENVHEVIIDNDEVIKVNGECFECYNIFQDLCKLIENESPMFFTKAIHIKVLSVLEIVENIIINHKLLFQTHQELAYLLRIKIIPSLLRILNSSHQRNFPYITRTMRVLHVLLASQLDNLEIECEIVLSFLNHILLNNENEGDIWEKILVLETYKGLFSDFHFVKSIFEKYDNNPRKKNVLQELIAILNTFLSSNSYLFNDIVKRPSIVSQPPLQQPSSSSSTSTSSLQTPQSPSKNQDQSSPIYLSKSSSHLKTPLIDHFDKSEPPTQLPKTYPIYLIYNILLSYADGIAGFVQSLSNGSDPVNLEADVEFTNAFIESNFKDISVLFERFIYSAMDDESFHLLIRSFQRFTHSTGLLGLTSIRDGLLIILSNSITHNISKDESKTLTNSGSSLQLQGKQLLAFGESLVESFSSTLTSQKQPSDTHPQPHPLQTSVPVTVRSRYINSRHVTCLRALANLAVSLGSTLQNSWTIIWITFQWCDYFINGPDEYSGFFNHKAYKSFTEASLPQLSPQDINNIELSKKKLMDSFKEYPVESYNELIKAILELSNRVFEEQDKPITDIAEEDEDEDGPEVEYDEKKPFTPPSTNGHSNNQAHKKHTALRTCPYNKTYFVDRLLEFCQIESNKFLILDNKSWDLITEYFIKLGNRRDIAYNLRLYIVQTYNQIIKNLSDEGFGVENEQVNYQTSIKSLDGLNRYLIGLFNLGIPHELLVLNCETEIHLSTLTILHQLIDQYDSYYKNSWHTVFTILNTPFKVTQDTLINKDEVNLRERIRLLIEKSFDTLKLILDEFLTSIPSNQLILLIDTLYNFCSQTFDLNISFSSISYFWLISDSLKSRILKFDNEKSKLIEQEIIHDEAELITKINQTQNDKDEYLYHTLIIIYLLSKLVKLSLDTRAQVRDGSIQTFFQIIEIHGDLITESKSWDLIYTIVLPNLFNIELNLTDSKFNRKEWIESLHLILTGLILIYNKFMIKFDQIPNIIDKWIILIKYFTNLLNFKWIDLNLKVFKSFQDLLIPFQDSNITLKSEFRDLLFKFWYDIPVEYDFINPLYQESITSFMNCFTPLYPIIKSTDVSNEEIQIILNLLNKCARYPILPDNQGDNVKPSKLQRAVLNNLTIIQIDDGNIKSQIIQQLSNIIVYPFGTRLRIEQKLTNNKLINGNKFKLPTFIAISHLSLELLREKLLELNGDDFAILLKDKGINKILKSLLEVIKSRSIGIVSKEKSQIWIESNVIVKNIIKQLIESGQDIDEELWKLIVESIKLCFVNNKDDDKKSNEDELINIEQYQSLIEIILPRLIETSGNKILEDFIETIYENSFLYEFDESESLMIKESNNDSNELISLIIKFNFNETFGSTKTIKKFNNKCTRFNCLTELIKFCLIPQESILNITSQNYFIIRSIFCIRRFISDQKLLYKCPISKIQQQELLIILRGIIDIRQREQAKEVEQKFKQLNGLMVKLIPFSDRINGLEQLLEIVLQKLT